MLIGYENAVLLNQVIFCNLEVYFCHNDIVFFSVSACGTLNLLVKIFVIQKRYLFIYYLKVKYSLGSPNVQCHYS